MIGAQVRNIRRTGIPASKGGKPNPEYPHGVYVMIVDDPYALEPGEKTEARRDTRRDPLAALHARKQIDEAQYQGGRAFQDDFETIQGGQQACDPSEPYVDRSFRHRGISEAYSKAFARLNRANRDLGVAGSALTHAVLIDGQTCAKFAEARELRGERWEKFFGMRFRECLDCLALAYGFAMEKRP
jgi:hypothetical protein